jgi:hypothetical protein
MHLLFPTTFDKYLRIFQNLQYQAAWYQAFLQQSAGSEHVPVNDNRIFAGSGFKSHENQIDSLLNYLLVVW